MEFPKTLPKLLDAGYKLSNQGFCRGCGAAISWYVTPAGKSIPMDIAPDETVTAHWASCPQAHLFRKDKPKWQKQKAKAVSRARAQPRPQRR